MKAIEWIWGALVTILVALVYLFWPGLDNGQLKEKVLEINKSAREEKRKQTEIRNRMESRNLEQKGRQDKARKLSDRLNKLPVILFLILICSASGLAENLCTAENIIPDDYESLLEYYREMSEIAVEYKSLYEEAEKSLSEAQVDIQAMMESNDRLQELIKTQQTIIDQLLKRKDISLETGLNFVPLDPLRSGIIIGIEWSF